LDTPSRSSKTLYCLACWPVDGVISVLIYG
jgi:hypothetical protein